MSAQRQLRRKEKLAEIVVGLLFFLALILLGVYTIMLKRESLFEKTYQRTIAFSQTAAIQKGDRVLLRGYEVGRVAGMTLADNGSMIHVLVELDENLSFYKDHKIEIRSSSILGGRHVYIELGDPASGVEPPDAILHGTAPGDPLMEMSAAIDQLKGFAEDMRNAEGTLHQLIYDRSLFDEAKNSFASLKQAGDDVSGAAKQVQQISGRVDASFDKLDEITESVKTATDGLKNIGSTIETAGKAVETAGNKVGEAGDTARAAAEEARQSFGEVRTLVADLRDGKGSLGKMMTDETLYNEVRAAVADLREATERLQNKDSTLARLMTDDGKLYDQVNGSFGRLNDAMKNLEDIGAQIKSGQGNLGKLVYDDQLYQEIRAAVGDVRNAINDFREQTPVATFGSLVFGAL